MCSQVLTWKRLPAHTAILFSRGWQFLGIKRQTPNQIQRPQQLIILWSRFRLIAILVFVGSAFERFGVIRFLFLFIFFV
jgi:hypothetical protein